MNPKGPRLSISRVIGIAFVLAVGLLLLAGYFFPIAILSDLRTVLLNLAIILAGFAVLLGIANLLNVHFKKIRLKQKGAAYSAILVIALAVTFLLGLAGHYIPLVNAWFSAAFNYIQLPVEATLMGILAITLTYASIRLLRQRFNMATVIFLVTALLILLGSISLPFLGEVPVLSTFFRPFIDRVLSTAGARGLLLGVSLGIIATGLRVLFGADRPYGAK